MKLGIAALAVVVSTAAFGQQTTTKCTPTYGGGVNCVSDTTQSQRLDPRLMEPVVMDGFAKGWEEGKANRAAIAADRERRKAKRIQKEIAEAGARDTDPPPGPPPPEAPVLLACTVEGQTFSVSLYPNSGRADVTSNGYTRMRASQFTKDTVTWSSPSIKTTISRLDLSLDGEVLVPSAKGTRLKGSCALAEVKF